MTQTASIKNKQWEGNFISWQSHLTFCFPTQVGWDVEIHVVTMCEPVTASARAARLWRCTLSAVLRVQDAVGFSKASHTWSCSTLNVGARLQRLVLGLWEAGRRGSVTGTGRTPTYTRGCWFPEVQGTPFTSFTVQNCLHLKSSYTQGCKTKLDWLSNIHRWL